MINEGNREKALTWADQYLSQESPLRQALAKKKVAVSNLVEEDNLLFERQKSSFRIRRNFSRKPISRVSREARERVHMYS